MKKTYKILLLILCAALLVAGSVMGTLAYLTSQDQIVNTFTYGNVRITLDEAKVDEYGNAIKDAGRVDENTYKLIPGMPYTKDPTVTVLADSEASYIRIVVQVSNVAALKKAFPAEKYPTFWNGNVFLLQMLVDWNSEAWKCVEATADGKYVFDYKQHVSTVDAEDMTLEPLFTTINVPGTMDNDAVAALDQVNITITAYAVQAAGFVSAHEAHNAAFPNA